MSEITIDEQKEFWEMKLKEIAHVRLNIEKELRLLSSPGYFETMIFKKEKELHEIVLQSKIYYMELELLEKENEQQ